VRQVIAASKKTERMANRFPEKSAAKRREKALSAAANGGSGCAFSIDWREGMAHGEQAERCSRSVRLSGPFRQRKEYRGGKMCRSCGGCGRSVSRREMQTGPIRGLGRDRPCTLRGEGYSITDKKNATFTSKRDARAALGSGFCEERLLFFAICAR
jgi:hypothetical protein